MRMAAAKRISEELNIPGFGSKDVISKFKNLRSSYCQELKKIADSERSEAGTDDIYRPKIIWFELMNSFIRPFVQQRPTQSNLLLPTTATEESQQEQSKLDESQSPSQHQSSVDHLNEKVSSTPQITAGTEAPRRTVKRQMPSTVSQPSSSNKKALLDPQITFMSGAIEKLENISNRAALITKEDTYDHFGKYVASMLRSIGPPTAMRLQETITSFIINAMCPPPTPSNQSADLTSGTESNMSGFSEEFFFTKL
ncbi:uncharacterized protein [Onthophagus taurus]